MSVWKAIVSVVGVLGALASIYALTRNGGHQQGAEFRSGRDTVIVNSERSNITIENEESASDSHLPRIRATYWRMGGMTPEFLVRGLLSDEWEKILGGPQDIVNNEVLDQLREVVERFSASPYGNLLWAGDQKVEFDDYARMIGREPPSASLWEKRPVPGYWRVYQGGQGEQSFVVPDVPAVRATLHTDEWPPGYGFYFSRGFPVSWRYLNVQDITRYEQGISRYYDAIGGRCGGCFGPPTDWNFAQPALRGLAYIGRDGLPAGFMVVRGKAGGHGGWGLETVTRDIELEALALENVLGRTVELGDARVSVSPSRGLTAYSPAQSVGRTRELRLFPPGLLRPGETIIVPLKINFVRLGKQPRDGEAEGSLEDAKAGTSRFVKRTERGFSIFGWRGEFLFRKSATALKATSVPKEPERFSYGPTWSVLGLEVNGSYEPVRRVDWERFTLYLGNEKGSCPFVYTRDSSQDVWVSEGHILLGATSPEATRTDTIDLDRFDGSIQIRENEDEVAIIRHAEVRLLRDGVVLATQALDFEPEAVVARGAPLEIGFELPAIEYDAARLSVSGYYLPFSDPKIQAAVAGIDVGESATGRSRDLSSDPDAVK